MLVRGSSVQRIIVIRPSSSSSIDDTAAESELLPAGKRAWPPVTIVTCKVLYSLVVQVSYVSVVPASNLSSEPGETYGDDAETNKQLMNKNKTSIPFLWAPQHPPAEADRADPNKRAGRPENER